MSSTSMAMLSELSWGVVGVIAPFPWPLVNTHEWIGNPAALAWRLRPVGLFMVAPGVGQPTPTSLLCWALGVPGQDTEESDGAPGMGKRVEEDEVEEGVVSIASRRGCSWRIDSWVRERRGERRGRRTCDICGNTKTSGQ